MNEELQEIDALLRRTHADDLSAREPLLVCLRARARRHAEFLLGQHPGPRSDASDVAQQAVVRALEDQFDPKEFESAPCLVGWLNEVVRSVAADIGRYNTAKKRDIRRDVAGGEVFPALASDTTDVPDRVERAEREEGEARRLAAALKKLPVNQQIVFRLRVVEGLPFAEVSERAGVKEGTARVLLLRATKSLRGLLGEQT